MGGGAARGLCRVTNDGCHIGCHLGFYQELEIRLKPPEIAIFFCFI